MAISFLPPKGTKEAEGIIRRYRNGELETLWREFGYKKKANLHNAMHSVYGVETVLAKKENSQTTESDKIILPPIKLREYKPDPRKQGDEEQVVLHCGDGHAGKITISFDEDVYLSRMNTIFDSVMTIATLHRKMYPIRVLRIIDCGDNVQGENPHQGSKIGSVKMGVRDQKAKLALPAWVGLICSLKQEFEEVIFDGYAGNHGADRLAPETSKADLELYDLLEAKIGDIKGITINIHEEFGGVVNIWDWRFFIAHLDGIPCNQGIPYFGIDRALKSWYMQFGGFDYALGGHFHKKHLGDEVSAVVPDFLMCSTLVSDDDWALKKLKISSKPSQNIFGVHPRHGITWRYPLIVDKKEGK